MLRWEKSVVTFELLVRHRAFRCYYFGWCRPGHFVLSSVHWRSSIGWVTHLVFSLCFLSQTVFAQQPMTSFQPFLWPVAAPRVDVATCQRPTAWLTLAAPVVIALAFHANFFHAKHYLNKQHSNELILRSTTQNDWISNMSVFRTLINFVSPYLWTYWAN